MIYDYPVIIADNFFKYPQDVRELALSMDYYPSEIGIYSGVRTESLHLTHTNFFREVCCKILNSYSLRFTDYIATMHFHLTGEEFGDNGWVHIDGSTVIASIIYLNLDNNDIDTGTCLYKLKNLNHGIETLPAMKKSFITAADNRQVKIQHNQDYTPVVKIGNMFNRMIAYDARNPHAGSSYYGNSKETERLTLLTFFEKIILEDNTPPLRRADRFSKL